LSIYDDAIRSTGVSDDFDPAIERAELLKSQLHTLQQELSGDVITFRKLTDDLRDGTVDASKLVEQLTQQRDERKNVEDAVTFVKATADTLRRDRTHALTERADSALAYLRDQLARIHGETVTVVEMLGSVRTPDEAITGGLGEPWSQLRKLASEYSDLRTAQRKLMYPDALAVGMGDIPQLERAWIRGLDLLELIHQEVPRPAPNLPYPTREGRPDITPEYMRWLAGVPLADDDGDGVGVWLPTRSELNEELARRGERANARTQLRDNPFLSEQARLHLEKVACGSWDYRSGNRVFILDRSAVVA
jgi:cell division protein FtsB